MSILPLVFTWRGNDRATLRLFLRSLKQGHRINSSLPVGHPPFYFTPVGAPATITATLQTLLLWVNAALAQQSTPQVFTPPGPMLTSEVLPGMPAAPLFSPDPPDTSKSVPTALQAAEPML